MRLFCFPKRLSGLSLLVIIALSLMYIVAGAGKAAAGEDASTTTTIMAEMHRIMGNITDTRYQHSTEVSEEQGHYYVDCSGLVLYVMSRACPDRLARMREVIGRERLTATNFYNCFDQMSRAPDPEWLLVNKVIDIQPGDIIVWKREPPQPGNTGHIVFADSSATLVSPQLYAVTIIDSTTRPHWNDTRKEDQGGIGRGVFWIETDPEGRPKGFRRGTPQSSLNPAPMLIARPIDDAK
ncbi:MAG TPA: hypothetical protein PLB62_00615 [Candidatus Sumerlaeota bacterium]|nr:hypothetical protein [Candidatus Sumerlaeota bacterium]